MKPKLSFLLILSLGILFLFSAGCRSFRVEHNLIPSHEDFISEVRYIITKQEKKIFLSLTTEDREDFIQEFWKKRDPDPSTEENEFKEQYYYRIERANKLFKEGGTPGWLQDRGRIWILLGPPDSRDVYPMGYRQHDRPSELWLYGFYPILFIDYSFTGNYRIYPLSAQYLAILLKAQLDRKPGVSKDEQVFDFGLKLDKFPPDRILLKIQIPYKEIWLVENEGVLEAELSVQIEVFSGSKKIWKYDKDHKISLTAEELKESIKKQFEIPVEIKLSPDDYKAAIIVENKTDNKKVSKSIKFSLK
ncbi:MAG: GWxTD domain-containing protein [Candidatus Aminicenantes bacterium]|nr:GWxTD domain-containing protein [Candidatus Aminicenantes bacterium]